MVLTGAGGLGKTRTAVETCAAAQRAGWSAGLMAVVDSGSLDTLLTGLAANTDALRRLADACEKADGANATH